MITTYFQKIEEKLKMVLLNEQKQMELAAEKIAESIQGGGIVQLFGCGHSHILTEEVFYRAGGLAPIKPIFHEPLMLHEGVVRSSQLERQNDYAASFIQSEDIHETDCMIVLSTSGRNPVPVDVALFSKQKGAYVIGVTSITYSESQPPRHKLGLRLGDVVDLVINNHSEIGDAVLFHDEIEVPFAPTSTVVGATIVNSIFAEAIKIMTSNGFEPPVFLSGNLEGADGHNSVLVEKYKGRIPLLAVRE
ncbi:SIS domain-containing protein [Evansella sp. AB-rgal1]|uniref:SIS domain-containing protein n=1 Tax=Evansella sp. AB-rgal1 TaxID=3242696 RepID=UPI00359E3A30